MEQRNYRVKPNIIGDDENDKILDTVDDERPVRSGTPRKLKYRHKGFRIESSSNGIVWTLYKYYRSEVDMRKALAGISNRSSRSHMWDSRKYRMVFPDGKIVDRSAHLH